MPHFDGRNATLQRMQCLTWEVEMPRIGDDEVWHCVRRSVASETIDSVLETINPELPEWATLG